MLKPSRKIITAKPAAGPVAKPAATPATATAKPATATATPKPAKPVTTKPATTGDTAPRVSGNVHRAATKPQLYGADKQSPRDEAYLAFFASYLRGKQPDAAITYAEIAERSKPASGRNPLPEAGAKNGALDRGILSRFDKFGLTVNVTDPSDKARRIGFRFTPQALALAAVKAGMRTVYENGMPKA